jgi:hypothetical protein
MGGEQQSGKRHVVKRLEQKVAANVAPREDRLVNGVARHRVERIVGKCMNGRHRLSPCDLKRVRPPDHADDFVVWPVFWLEIVPLPASSRSMAFNPRVVLSENRTDFRADAAKQ